MKRNSLLRTFGRAIRNRRNELGVTQMKLAELIGCSLQHIGNVERGETNTSLLMVYRIANTLKTCAKDLLP